MKITQHTHDRLMIAQRRLGLRLLGLVLLGISGYVLAFVSSGQSTRCRPTPQPTCAIFNTTLLSQERIVEIEFSAVETIHVVNDAKEGEEANYCATIVTKGGETWPVGRCSLQDEAYLHQLASDLDGFYEQPGKRLELRRDDSLILWCLVVALGSVGLFLMLALPWYTITLDRAIGTARVCTRWIFLFKKERSLSLGEVRAVESVVTGSDAEGGTHRTLFLITHGDQRFALGGESQAHLEPILQAIEGFLGQSAPSQDQSARQGRDNEKVRDNENVH